MMKRLIGLVSIAMVLCTIDALAVPGITNTTYLTTAAPAAAGRLQYWQQRVSFADNNLAANGAMDIFTLPARSIILAAGAYNVTSEGAAATAGWGIPSSSNLFCNVDLNNGGTNSQLTTASFPYQILAATNCQLYVGAAMDTAVVDLWVVTIDADKH